MTEERSENGSVAVSNIDKVLFPGSEITKGEMIDYYREVAQVMVPHMQDRPLTLQRFPDGIDADGFIQQRSSEHFPNWIKTIEVPRAGGSKEEPVEHVLCNDSATLSYLANQAVVALHGWLSRAPHLEQPDRLIIDVDPTEEGFTAVRRNTRRIVELMQQIGLAPFAMTTGSRGLHVVAPLRGEAGFDTVRELATNIAQLLADRYPKELTVEQRKDQRGERIYLDVMRNSYGQTGIMPYSLRALPGAPVATPLDLHELHDSRVEAQRWHLRNLRRRLGQKGDPWADINDHATAIEPAIEAIHSMQND